MKWYAAQLGVDIRTADSPEGEFKVTIGNGKRVKIDGYIPKEFAGTDKDVAIEYLGCAYHGICVQIPLINNAKNIGHDCLYKDREEICLNGKTAGLNYDWTMERCELIEQQGFEVRKYWECEIDEQLRNDREMKLYFDLLPGTSCVIDLREAFMGGRVGPFSLKCDLTEYPGALEKYNIYHYDIVSLYPYTNMNCEVSPPSNIILKISSFQYPVGHPTVHVINKPVLWTDPGDNPYRGVLKVCLCEII